MRAKRAKQYRKLMQQYQMTFSFREPYQVLLDSSIIRDAARYKMRLGSLLSTTLHGEIKPMITQCCIRHLYALPTTTPAEKQEKDAWIEVAKQAERRLCGHHELEEPLSAEECVLSVLDPKGAGVNKHRYVVATQEYGLRARLRRIAGVPLVYINRSVMILEPMGQKTEEAREADEKSKVRAGLKGRRPNEMANVGKRKRDEEDGDVRPRQTAAGPAQKKQKKAKGPKGPNPLAVKKAKKEPATLGGTTNAKDDPDGERAIGARKDAADSAPHHHQKPKEVEVTATDSAEDGAAGEAARKRRRKRKPSGKAGGSDGDGAVDEGAPASVAVDVA